MVLKKFNITQSIFSIAKSANYSEYQSAQLERHLSLRGNAKFNRVCHCEKQSDEAIQRNVQNQHRGSGLPHLLLPKSRFRAKWVLLKGFHWSHAMTGFSLVEMLMALLVASLLLAALAPVMTRRMNEALTINSNVNFSDGETVVKELTFGMNEQTATCTETGYEYDSKGNITGEYCEGTFVVPNDVHQLKVIAIGAGGGGGTAPTAGYIEYTNAGSTNTFTVPLMTNKLEATLISGGGGGGAGGQVETTVTFDKPGVSSWDNIPKIIKGKYVNIMGCAGGGGGGGAFDMSPTSGEDYLAAGAGGSGGYLKTPIAMYIDPSLNSIPYQVGGGGGGGSNGLGGNAAVNFGGAGACGGGGDGGSDDGAIVNNTCNPKYGGTSGTAKDDLTLLANAGGGYPSGGVGQRITFNSSTGATQIRGGIGNEGGNGGNSGASIANLTVGTVITGGGGGKYGGGGGGCSSVGSGGGGGGPTYFNNSLIASGGGGGGSGGLYTGSYYVGGGGGGGGGKNGGAGGDGASVFQASSIRLYSGLGGQGGWPNGTNAIPGWSGWDTVDGSTIYGYGYCDGGIGGGLIYTGNTVSGQNGKSGIIKVTYLDYGPGGSGGGGASIVPVQQINNIMPNELLSVEVGSGGNGGLKGYIDATGDIIEPIYDETSLIMTTKLKDSSGKILLSALGGLDWCPRAGHHSGQIYGWGQNPFYGHPGAIYNGITAGGAPGDSHFVAINGFTTEIGHTAGNGATVGNIIYPNGSIGGDGGAITTPWFVTTCTPGKGGTASNPTGGNASGFGCGGGGGYGLADGGKGSGGYARISWNMYWDVAANAYKRAEITASGGASGNTIISGLNVIPGDIIRFRIGKGGAGAFVSGNVITEAKSGGTTVFGCSGNDNVCNGGIRAGGGGGGGSPTINSTNELINGTAGVISAECKAGGRNYINNTSICTKGTPGKVSSDKITGGEGAPYITPVALSKYSDKLGSNALKGTGGKGGIQDTGENANGKPGSGIGAGGGGAAIKYNETTSVINGSETSNTITGGAGASGKIILEWIKI